MRETWYVLDDNSVVHPGEVDHATMKHKNGKVAMRGDVPSTRSVEVDESGKRLFSGPHDHLGEKASVVAKDAKPEAQSAGYKTRDAKSR